MNRLTSVIGPAPSELTWDELKAKIQNQRERLRRAFEYWQSSVGRKTTRKKKAISLKDIRLVAKSMGITVEELEKLMAEEVERRTNNAC